MGSEKQNPRRGKYNLLKSTIVGVAAFAATLSPMAANATTIDTLLDQDKSAPATTLQQTPLNPMLASELKNAPQFALFGDTNHLDLSILEFMSRRDSLATLQDAGFTSLALERPADFQYLADDLVGAKISKEEFIEKMDQKMLGAQSRSPEEIRRMHELTADIILNAKSLGLSVDFIDSDTSFEEALNTKTAVEKIHEALSKDIKAHPEKLALLQTKSPKELEEFLTSYAEDYISAHPDAIDLSVFAKDNFLQKRLSHDKILAQEIKQRYGDEKVAILYGVMHLDHGNDGLEQCLGKENVKKIALCGAASPDSGLGYKSPWTRKGRSYHVLKNEFADQEPSAFFCVQPTEAAPSKQKTETRLKPAKTSWASKFSLRF